MTAGVVHAVVSSRQCVTGRHLLERILTGCIGSLGASSEAAIDQSAYSRCESLSALATHLQRLLQGRGKFVLALDGIDRQRDAPPTLFPALARFGEMVHCIRYLSDSLGLMSDLDT